ncbi:MAG: nodulation protein NfeD [Nitrososphaerales archaeon]
MRFVPALLVITVALSVFMVGSGEAQSKNVLWVEVKDFISSATAEDIASAVDETSADEYSAIVLALDTPGGSLEATLEIIESMQRSDVPIVGYVYPQGKSAWSAGTIILIASDYAAMAPVTTIGSAQPVLGTQPVNDTKIINALVEKVVSIAELHGRNTTQAARFITHNDNLTPEKALERGVIEGIAEDPQRLLEKVHNAEVMTLEGQKVLDTKDAKIVKHERSLRVELLQILSDPLLATVLLTIGFFALIYGLTSPGFGGEIAGAILIILGLMGQGFDVNWAAFALLAIGVGLLAYELYSPGFGAMGIGGVIVISVGTALMITQPVKPLLVPEEQLGNLATLSTVIIAPFAGFLGFITYKVWRAKTKKRVEFVYQREEGKALDPISSDKEGFVLVGGEYWKATSKKNIKRGQLVRVIEKRGNLLVVEATEEKSGGKQ